MSKITTNNRLGFALLFSVIMYLIILFQVSFTATSPLTNKPLVNLSITLVKQQTERAPEQADFLAQVNNDGGGNVSESSARARPPPQSEQPTADPIKRSVPVKAEKKPPAKPTKILSQAKALRKVKTTLDADEKANVVKKVTPKPSARDLIFQARTDIRDFEKGRNDTTTSTHSKKRRLSPRTKEFSGAAYYDAWVKKVERIGNLNYPQEAKRKKISGRLMLSVDINPDGSVSPDGIVITRPSGYKVLDDAAIRTVLLGAPYAVIPENVLKDSDMITISLMWQFISGRGLGLRTN